MKKTVAILTIFFYFVFCIYSVKYVYADWASPIVKQVSKSFVYNGLQYTVKITDTITSAKATTLAKSVVNSPFTKVAIPLGWLGLVATAAQIGYLVYDLSTQKQLATQQIQIPRIYTVSNSEAQSASCPGGEFYFSDCGVSFRNCIVESHLGYGYSYNINIDNGNIYLGSVTSYPYEKTITSSYLSVMNNGQFVMSIYMGTIASLNRYCQSGGTPITSDIPHPSEEQIKDWVEANRDSFDTLTPQLSPTKPEDAIEVSNTEYPDITAQVDSTPDPSEESQPNPEEQPMPQPENPDSNFINPGLPDIPNFDSSFQVPEKKSFSDLLDRFFASIPFIGALRQTSISASGQCSFSVQTPFNTSGVMNFCQYDDIFSVIGGFIFTFASIYAIYIIFKRSD